MILSMFHWSFLIFFLIPTVGALNLLRPQVIVPAGWDEKAKLSCRPTGRFGGICIWTKEDNNGESTTIATSYSYYDKEKYILGDPLVGDCSITIHHLDYQDDGNLTCVFWPSGGFFTAVWEVIVGKAPKQILIKHNGTELSLDKKNEIYPDEEGKAVITCIVGEGKPPAKVEWIGDIAPEDEISEMVEISTQSGFTTVHKILTMMINATDMKPERKVTCIAFHDLYKYKQEQKTVTVGVKYATKNISILGSIQFTGDVECQGDGIPEPSYRWQYKKIGSVEWSELTSSRYATLKDYGEYRCQARNELNSGHWKTSSIILFRPEGISNVCTSPGIIN